MGQTEIYALSNPKHSKMKIFLLNILAHLTLVPHLQGETMKERLHLSLLPPLPVVISLKQKVAKKNILIDKKYLFHMFIWVTAKIWQFYLHFEKELF